MVHLLCLLHRLPTDIAVDIRSISRLASQPLYCLPRIPHSRWYALVRHERVHPRNHLPNSPLHKTALAVPSADKDRVDDQEDPATLGKDDGRGQDAEPEKDLEGGDEGHASIVVFFHEFTDGVG